MYRDDAHHLIYCHIPKMGGTFITDAMQLLWEAQMIPGTGMHQPLSNVTNADREGYRTFASTRAPWSFYQAVWMHVQRAVGSPPLEVFPTEEAARLAIQSMRAYGAAL